MKFISWNVNGIRACVKKGFLEYFKSQDADFLCIQESKLQEGQIDLKLDDYYQYWNYAEKKGYSGTAIFTKHKPLSVFNGIGKDIIVKEFHEKKNAEKELELLTKDRVPTDEGRVITLEYEDFYLVTVYTPNSKNKVQNKANLPEDWDKNKLLGIDTRMNWEDEFREYLLKLDEEKPVIMCGDLNVAHNEIDLKNPKTNTKNAGFTIEERNKMTELLESGFTDTFRYLYPDKTDAYSWWSYRAGARDRNIGWRIDYFIVSDTLNENIIEAKIDSDTLGSDHCPVVLDLDL